MNVLLHSSHSRAHSPTRPAHQRVILVIDDHPLVCSALRELITRYCRGVDVRSCSSLLSGLLTLRDTQPALVLLDLNLPDGHGEAVVEAVRERLVPGRLAIISGNDELAHSLPGVASGAIPYLKKGLSEREFSRRLFELLRRCGLADVATPPPETKAPAFEQLSPRQREILRLLATGLTNGEIAAALHVSADTIKTHMRDVFAKLQVRNRTEAVLRYQAGWSDLSEPDGHG
jgi:two-component system nitrate/nitrite response regulator NarL